MATSLSAATAAPPPKHNDDAATGLLVVGGLGAVGLAGWILLRNRRSSSPAPPPPKPPPPRPVPPGCPVPTNSLVVDSRGTVYVIDAGCRRWGLTSAFAFDYCHYSQGAILSPGDAAIAAIPLGGDIGSPPRCCPPAPTGPGIALPVPPNTLAIGDQRGTIYWVDQNNYRHGFPSAAAYFGCGHSFAEARRYPQAWVDSMPEGQVAQPGNCYPVDGPYQAPSSSCG